MVTHRTVAVMAQRGVDGKKNEISESEPLLANMDLAGKVVAADAMHTQRETARHLVKD